MAAIVAAYIERRRRPARRSGRRRQAARMAGDIRIGLSGWRYPPWRGAFYPRGLVQAQELAHAARQVPAIEINGSFYSLQRPESYRRWADAVPEGFRFAVKAPRFITHVKRLREARPALANFFASGVLALGHKLGPVLWQLPPGLPFDAALLDVFLAMLPRSLDAAARLAREREPRMHERELLRADARGPLHHALEVRHPSFVDPDFIALLRRHGVAFVVADAAGRFPEFADVTADFVYLRLHGARELYRSGYSARELATWERRLRTWACGGQPRGMARIDGGRMPARPRNVYCFFDNTDKRQAPRNAVALRDRLGIALRE